MEDKDKTSNIHNNIQSKMSIDLHGYTLDQANNKVRELILNCFENGIRNINIITGKGNRSSNQKDTYQSKDLSILKYAVPEQHILKWINLLIDRYLFDCWIYSLCQ